MNFNLSEYFISCTYIIFINNQAMYYYQIIMTITVYDNPAFLSLIVKEVTCLFVSKLQTSFSKQNANRQMSRWLDVSVYDGWNKILKIHNSIGVWKKNHFKMFTFNLNQIYMNYFKINNNYQLLEILEILARNKIEQILK